MRILAVLLVVVVVATSVAGCSKPPPAGPTKTVEMKDFEFSPANITVEKGTKVTWKNVGAATHTTDSEGAGPLDSGNVIKGASYSYTFTETGVFKYYCKPHEAQMKGTVTVT